MLSITVDDTNSIDSPEGQAAASINITYGPTISAPSSAETDVLTPVVFSSDNGNAVTVADPGSSVTTLTVAMSVGYGTLSLADTSGLTFLSGTGTDDSSMNFTGTATDINTALDGLTYTPDGSSVGQATINMSVDDPVTLAGNANQATASIQVETDPAATGPTVVAPSSAPPTWMKPWY